MRLRSECSFNTLTRTITTTTASTNTICTCHSSLSSTDLPLTSFLLIDSGREAKISAAENRYRKLVLQQPSSHPPNLAPNNDPISNAPRAIEAPNDRNKFNTKHPSSDISMHSETRPAWTSASVTSGLVIAATPSRWRQSTRLGNAARA